MKKTTRTLIKEYNDEGKLIKETETTVEETYKDYEPTWYTTSPTKPNYYKYEISTSTMDCNGDINSVKY